MSNLPEPIPINALFSADDVRLNPEQADEIRTWLHEADLIFGTDVMSGREFIVYGRDVVQRIAQGEPPGEDVRILNIAVDQEKGSDDLERVMALVVTVKGRHDYIALGESEPKQ